MASDNEITFQPIFKGQKTNNPEEIARLASEGAEYDHDFLRSRGGSWRDPFTGVQIGQAVDWTGVSQMATVGAGGQLTTSPNVPFGHVIDPTTGESTGTYLSWDNEGNRLGDVMVAGDIVSPAKGMSEEELLDIAGRVAIVNTFQQDRVALIEQYGDYFLEEVGTDIVGGSVSKLDELRFNSRGYDLLTGGVPSSYRDEDYVSVDDDAMAAVAGNSMSLAMMKSNLEVYGTLVGPYDAQYREAAGMVTSQSAVGSSAVDMGANESSGTPEQTFSPNETATGILRNTLKNYGLESLLNDSALDLENLYVSLDDMDAVWAAVRQSATYATRFPGMAGLSALGRAITEAEYITLETSYAQTLNAYGMPKTFYDGPEDFGSLIAGDVSPSEFAQRVQTAYEAQKLTSPEVRTALTDYYQITDGDLTAYYLDPERATNIFEERERLGTAKFSAIATEYGSPITQQTAEALQEAGFTETQARRGFQKIAQSTLDEETVSEQLQGDDITFDDLTQAEFNLDPEAARRSEQRRQRRLAEFSQTGGPLLTQGGYTGLGSAR
ncbi:MAG: hypothetical protein CMG34_07405 [Candidatus Marinimicrobia bacterium]|nr:hypothetical protein [Candidatus Neomarinimicrobiota bacterium]|tara:strand:+ start:1138 stop:2793 length:1656 start_codon:yes stop_codon:yes gene_type:complete